ncbi:MAG: SDR family NAD(P)-dependent oxidoreductase [Burkholderiales bacterium]|jgi:short-subunit dehydrogenase|nr:SDR family NAD(P)-dependent oxidoreductase [Burkholderiales bacterium]
MPLNPPIRDWRGQRVWVVGASTGIGAATAALLLERGARVALSARQRAPLDAMAAGRAPDAVRVLPVDMTDTAAVAAAHTDLIAAWGAVDVVLIVAGTYAPMRAWELDLDRVRQVLAVNVDAVFGVLHAVLPPMLARGGGHIGIFSSVAGYRGLPKALVYGPSKAAMINLAETLYLDVAPRGVGVSVINPGFVRTPLTAGNDFEMPALIEPEEAAASTLAGLERGEFEIHYPKRFTRMLKLLRLLPYRLYFAAIRRSTGL